MCNMVQKSNGNLDCSYYETCTHKQFSGILHACKMVELHYFEYADLRLDGTENNLQKQKDYQSYTVKHITHLYRIEIEIL